MGILGSYMGVPRSHLGATRSAKLRFLETARTASLHVPPVVAYLKAADKALYPVLNLLALVKKTEAQLQVKTLGWNLYERMYTSMLCTQDLAFRL